MRSRLIDRRAFVRGAGLTFLAALKPSALMALERADAVYASGIRAADGSFAVATVTEQGRIVDQVALPARAHGMAFSKATGKTVAFARRPGTYAMIFDPWNKAEPIVISAKEGRHFYGHGTFSPDGRLLYASENDFDNNRGIIGLYDSSNRFARIGEYETYGVGPHDMTVSDDGRFLIVANGGIETLDKPMFVDNQLISVTGSVGLACALAHGAVSRDARLRRADAALSENII